MVQGCLRSAPSLAPSLAPSAAPCIIMSDDDVAAPYPFVTPAAFPPTLAAFSR